MFCKMTERHSDRIRLRVLNIELGDGLTSLRIVFLKLKNEVEPQMLISSLFHSHITFRKKEF